MKRAAVFLCALLLLLIAGCNKENFPDKIHQRDASSSALTSPADKIPPNPVVHHAGEGNELFCVKSRALDGKLFGGLPILMKITPFCKPTIRWIHIPTVWPPKCLPTFLTTAKRKSWGSTTPAL